MANIEIPITTYMQINYQYELFEAYNETENHKHCIARAFFLGFEDLYVTNEIENDLYDIKSCYFNGDYSEEEAMEEAGVYIKRLKESILKCSTTSGAYFELTISEE